MTERPAKCPQCGAYTKSFKHQECWPDSSKFKGQTHPWHSQPDASLVTEAICQNCGALFNGIGDCPFCVRGDAPTPERTPNKMSKEYCDKRSQLESDLIVELGGFDPWTHGKYPIAMETLADLLIDERMAAPSPRESQQEMYEDELPEDMPRSDYDKWFAHSRVDGVRIGPKYPFESASSSPSPSAPPDGDEYCKLPVVIRAKQWFKLGDHAKVTMLPSNHPAWNCPEQAENLGWIETLEGGYVVHVADWIIRGVVGEYYACKPDIFKATYCKASAPQTEPSDRALFEEWAGLREPGSFSEQLERTPFDWMWIGWKAGREQMAAEVRQEKK